MPVGLTSWRSQTNGLVVLMEWVVAKETTQCHLRRREIYTGSQRNFTNATHIAAQSRHPFTTDHLLWWIPTHDVTPHASTHSKTNHSVSVFFHCVSYCHIMLICQTSPHFQLYVNWHCLLQYTHWTIIRLTKVIVKNKMSRFFMVHCVHRLGSVSTTMYLWVDCNIWCWLTEKMWNNARLCCDEGSTDKHCFTVAAVAQQSHCTDMCSCDLTVQYRANQSVTSMQCS